MKNEPWFPIQGESGTDSNQHWHRSAGQIPWSMAKQAYERYANLYGRDQSLETLAARGGFSWSEIAWLLSGQEEFTSLPFSEPIPKKPE
jgi:hypothetical protein